MLNKSIYSHEKDDWETPQELFDCLSREFSFNLDIGATNKNSKCDLFIEDIEDCEFIPEFDGFAFCNPPYSSQRKFIEFSIKNKIPTVFLLLAITDTKMFHYLIYKKEYFEIRFLKGRLKFSESKNSAPFPSMIVIYNPITYDHKKEGI